MGNCPSYITHRREIRILFGGDFLTADQSELIIRMPLVSVLNRLANRALLAPKGGEGWGAAGHHNGSHLIRRPIGYSFR